VSLCDELQPGWALLLGLPADDPERKIAMDHASGCDRCTTEVRGMNALLGALDAISVPPPSESALRRAAAPVLEDMARRAEQRRRLAALTAAGASVLGFVLLVALAQERGSRWGMAVAFASVAAAATAAAVLFRARALWAILPISATMAVVLGDSHAFGLEAAMRCALGEAIGASLPLVALSYLLLRGRFSLGPSGTAAVAAGGALAGQAALVLTCPSHGIEHLMIFHAGTVALAAVLGYLWGQRPLILASRAV
jgi:hypothetical protein